MNNLNPYKNQNDIFTVYSFKDKEQWKQGRSMGIGGSEVASIIGYNTWQSNVDLYRKKVGLDKGEVESNKYIEYGVTCEPCIRTMWAKEFEDIYTMYYEPDTLLMNNNETYMLYSPDGLIYDKVNNRYGIWECKTSFFPKKWKGGEIPSNYLCQLLQGMLVTGYDFAMLRARIVYDFMDVTGKKQTYINERDYHFERKDYEADIEYLKKKETAFWYDNVVKKKQPELIVNI